MRPFDKLFEPFESPKLSLRNRVAMSPMTRHFGTNGLPPVEASRYYGRRAQGGASLIITEGVSVNHPAAALQRTIPAFHGHALTEWKKVADAVHAAGARVFPQLWHAGGMRVLDKVENPELDSIAPSADHDRRIRAMTEKDVADVVAAFGQAAADAKEAGFDGVAIHAGHGYLLDEFLWEQTNRRTDRYGGSLRARALFVAEVVAQVRRRLGPTVPIMLRLSQWKTGAYTARLVHTPDELETMLAPLVDAGVDIFDASTRRFWVPEFPGSELNFAGWIKKITGKTTMTVGSVGLDGPLDASNASQLKASATSVDRLGQLCEMLERGEFDIVAVGRAILTNPEWAQKVRAGRFDELKPFDADRVRTHLEPALD